MIDIETHKIIDLLESRNEEEVTEWLKTYPNIEIISRDGGIMYKSSSDKAHPKAKQIRTRNPSQTKNKSKYKYIILTKNSNQTIYQSQ